jgi:hypothetical protein
MKKRIEIEKQIYNSIAQSVPDVYDKIMQKCNIENTETEKKIVFSAKKAKRNKIFRFSVSLASLAVLAIISVFIFELFLFGRIRVFISGTTVLC